MLKNIFLLNLGLILSLQVNAQSRDLNRVTRELGPDPKQQQATNLQTQKDLELAFKYLDKNPKLIDEYITQKEYKKLRAYFDKNELEAYFTGLEVPTIKHPNGKTVIRLEPDVNGLLSLGESLRLGSNREHVLKLYETYYEGLDRKYRRGLVHPSRLDGETLAKLHQEVIRISVVIEKIDLVTPDDSVKPPSSFKYDCTKEKGVKPGRNGDASNRCLDGDFHADSLFSASEFPLKYYHTCIKSQGARGTCVSFAINAAIEAIEMKKNNRAYNLSEQFTFYDGVKRKSFWGRYSYGLRPGLTLSRFIDDKVDIQREKDWSYNRSMSMQDKSGKEHPKSCDGYPSNFVCTNYAFQAIEEISGPPWNRQRTYTIPERSTVNRFRITDYTNLWNPIITSRTAALKSAVNELNDGNPVILGYRIRDNFKDHDQVKADAGRVEWDSSASRGGGHAVLLLGFIPNNQLPSGYPEADERGYFIVKNSWGTGAADCGYYYVDFKHARKTLWSLHTIKRRKL